ncbi:MAG: hypothetical protein Q9206_003092 [Seirophora lacunosa]
MENIDYTSPFDSPVYTVCTGPNDDPATKRYRAHASILSKSPVLKKIVDGNWKETNDRSITLPNWGEETVGQAIEFLYSGCYTVSVPSDLKDIPLPPEPEAPRWQSYKITAEQGAEEFRLRPLPDLIDMECLGPWLETPLGFVRPDNFNMTHLQPSIWRAVTTGYTLLPDAKVYVLAEYLQLRDLQRFAFRKIQEVLARAHEQNRNPALVTEAVRLARYVYACTNAPNESEEPLRDLVSTCTAMWFMTLHGKEWEELMAEGGDFVVDVVRKVPRAWTPW